MLRVTEWASKTMLQPAFDQIEKYNPGCAVWRQNENGDFAVYRSDKQEIDDTKQISKKLIKIC